MKKHTSLTHTARTTVATTNFTVIHVEYDKKDNTLRAWDINGSQKNNDGEYYIDTIRNTKRLINKYSKQLENNGVFIKLYNSGTFRMESSDKVLDFPTSSVETDAHKTMNTPHSNDVSTNTNILNMIHNSVEKRPAELILSDVKWKYLVRSIIRGKNLMMTGPAGCGKTLAITTVAKALNRPIFYFNLGATQDPRSTLIGNTHFSKDTGTYFANSTFVNAIQTENAIILLDELSRANPEAWNILMTVLDETQRYLRIDESPTAPVIAVVKGVSFLATANIGMEYTSTRVIDRAILDRFQILEMDVLNKSQQETLIRITYPELTDELIGILSNIYTSINSEVMSDSGRISTMISTRAILQAAGLLVDGFNIIDVAEVCIFPFYSNDGGAESERTYVKQLIQRFIPDEVLSDTKMFDESTYTK